MQVSVSGGDSYAWQVTSGISDTGVPDPVLTPPGDTDYIVLVSNTCGMTPDTVTVLVLTVEAVAWPDTLVCPGDPVPLNATGGTIYQWNPAQGLSDATSATPIASVTSPTVFQVIVCDAIGCSDTPAVFISLYPAPTVLASPDQEIGYGDLATLYAIGHGVFTWTPDLYVETLDGARVPASATALSLLLVGILVAADRRAPSAIPLALAAGVGLMHGALNGAALAGAGGEALLALAGTAGVVLVVSLLVSRGVSSVTRPWQRVAVRAAGSWIAAIGLLYLGWALKGS